MVPLALGLPNTARAAAPQMPGAEGLKQWARALVALRAAGDLPGYAAQVRGLVAAPEDIDAALNPAISPAAVDKIKALHAELRTLADDKLVRSISIGADQTEPNVFSASAEEIAANAPGSVVAAEFPGGAVTNAAALKPGATYHELAFVKPGEAKGMKFHLFYWTRSKWIMLGPIWRVLGS